MPEMTVTAPAARRPLKSRGSVAVRRLAAALAARRVAPNAISLAGIAFAAIGAAALLATPGVDGVARAVLLVVAAVMVQLRLLCNLLDGLVAVEGGLGTPDGELFNEVPDRVTDTVLLVAAGIAGSAPVLGWAAALAALATAYVRVLGGALQRPQDFSGIGSKPRRMAVLTFACLAATADLRVLAVAVAAVCAAALATTAGRLVRLRRAIA